MPTTIRKPIKRSDVSIDSSSRDSQITDSQIDKIDHDLILLDNAGNIHKELLIEIRRDIDDYSQRLSKLRNRLTEYVEKYDDEHKYHDI